MLCLALATMPVVSHADAWRQQTTAKFSPMPIAPRNTGAAPSCQPAEAEPRGCVSLTPTRRSDSVRIVAKNNCPVAKIVNICARQAGRIVPIRQVEILKPRQSHRFEYADPGHTRIDYNMQYCTAGRSSNTNCVAACPGEAIASLQQ